ncbi:hypothetical protein ED312_23005 [Sinomicrobium pectinilyticum]|uniref:Uncharacterized protein n=1 Tax=Sinomicrobium pectinilyticum TaxID=1084421 RepID=A0A3N0CZ84_SINP1|nr:hypothetical protein ED312_23005 [Sinomicrobium pectinilyticum]
MPTISRSKFQSTIDVMSNLENILQEPLENYQIEKSKSFAGNALAHKFRHDYPAAIEKPHSELLIAVLNRKTLSLIP